MVRESLSAPDKLDRGSALLQQIKCAINDEGESNWIRGVRAQISQIGTSYPNESEQTLAEALSTYRFLMQTKDGFGAYIIWRDDINERIAMNWEFALLWSECDNRENSAHFDTRLLDYQ
jgi:hypothetical protein